MSRFLSVDDGNPMYENLSSYFLDGTTRVRNPTALRGRAESARHPNRPGEQPNGRGQLIPTSSQKPGNREGNARIPYARFQFTWPHDAAKPRELQLGDVCFLHKSSQCAGHGHNRAIKVTGLPQLNRILENEVAGVTTLDFSDPFMSSRVKAARVAHWEDAVKGAESEREAALVALRHYGDLPPWNAEDADATSRLRSAEQQLKAAQSSTPTIDDIDPETDWRAVTMLTEWTLDGLLINADDEVDVDDSDQPKLGRDDGLLLNVCVQGPSPMRNTAWQTKNFRQQHEYEGQHIDDSIPVLDKVFVGLFATAVRGDDGKLQRLKFKYKLYSGRQLHAMHLTRTHPGKLCLLVPAPFARGPSEAEFGRLMGAWRLGSVMDNKLRRDGDRLIQVNVCVEWWTLQKLRREYDDSSSSSLIGREVELRLSSPALPSPASASVADVLIVTKVLPYLRDQDMPTRISVLKQLRDSVGDVDGLTAAMEAWSNGDVSAVPDILALKWPLIKDGAWLSNYGADAETLGRRLDEVAGGLANPATREEVVRAGLLVEWELAEELGALHAQLFELAGLVARVKSQTRLRQALVPFENEEE